MDNKVQLALKDTVVRNDLDLLAMIHRWQFEGEWPATASTPFQRRWVSSDASTAILYVEDHVLYVRYLVVSGPNIDPVIRQLKAGLEVYSREEILSLFENSVESAQLVDLVAIAAVIAPSMPDLGLVSMFKKALVHSDSDVRKAAIFVVTYVPWPELVDAVMTVANSDDPLRSFAASVISGLA